MAAKIDQKSMKNRSPRWRASWHRFFSDFGRFGRPSWGQVGAENRSKIDTKRHPKNDAKMKASSRHLGGILGRKGRRDLVGSADTRGAVLPPVTGQKQEFNPEHAPGSPAPEGPADCQRLRRSPPAPICIGLLCC